MDSQTDEPKSRRQQIRSSNNHEITGENVTQFGNAPVCALVGQDLKKSRFRPVFLVVCGKLLQTACSERLPFLTVEMTAFMATRQRT